LSQPRHSNDPAILEPISVLKTVAFEVCIHQIEKLIQKQKGRNYYVQFEYDGELGTSSGSSSGGGSNNEFVVRFSFSFPQRDAAIQRLLNQARLADYSVDETWLQAAAEIGPDVWIALWMATPDEPAMNQVLDAWARWKYDLENEHGLDDVWPVFERICATADEEGQYETNSPAGHAVAMLAWRLDPAQLTIAAEPLIASVTAVGYNHGSRGDGLKFLSVNSPGTTPLEFPFYNGGTYTVSGGPRKSEQLRPSGLALAHAIWLANEQAVASGTETLFQQQLVPQLLRADVERRAPYALQFATYFGGPAADKFLIRKANWTRDARWKSSHLDFDWDHGMQVNRWLFWAATLPRPAGRQFRANRRDELFQLADEISANLFGVREDVGSRLPFLFVENDLGRDGIGRQY